MKLGISNYVVSNVLSFTAVGQNAIFIGVLRDICYNFHTMHTLILKKKLSRIYPYFALTLLVNS